MSVVLKPEVRDVHAVPVVDVVITPLSPTATNSPFPYVTLFIRVESKPDVRDVQETPSLDVVIVPESPTATKRLPP
jgi:hypothetical protein